MLVVFLDIDGVLSREDGPKTPDLVGRLNRITDMTGAVLVIHSTWRWLHSLSALTEYLRGWGVTGVVHDNPVTLTSKNAPKSPHKKHPLCYQGLVFLGRFP